MHKFDKIWKKFDNFWRSDKFYGKMHKYNFGKMHKF